MTLYTLLHASAARSGLSDDDIGAIFTTAKRVNTELGVTGLLAYDGKGFAQILEGDGDTLRTLYARIEHDSRHSGCVLLWFGELEERRFDGWSMERRPLSDLIMIQGRTI